MMNNAKNHKAAIILDQPDRLAAAKKFADELNDYRLWKIKISYQKRWTKHFRQKKAVEIQYVKPWRCATGPKTPAGKARSARNGGHCDLATCAIRRALAMQSRFLKAVRFYIRCRKSGIPVTEEYKFAMGTLGRQATAALELALILSSCNRAQQ